MLGVAHYFSKHGFLFGAGVCLPIIIFIYFGHVRLNSTWIQQRIVAETEIFGFTDSEYDARLFFSRLISKFSSDNQQSFNLGLSFEYMKKSLIFRQFINKGLRFEPVEFDPSKDVFVLLHIQKTGGSSFGRILALEIMNLTCKRIESGRKQHDCSVSLSDNFPDGSEKRAVWMFSRFSVGWACGLHADWTELNTCVDKVLSSRETLNRTRRYHYITMLREPVSRYVSEWRHIARGATWAGAELRCNGRQASLAEVPFCYEGNNWRGVSLTSFINCQHNLANNRQTRMLSDLSKVNCYNKSGMNPLIRSETMFLSALENLASFSFFGLSDNQKLSQWLFEHTFTNLHFKVNMTRHETKAERFLPTLTAYDLSEIRRVNFLDVMLYDFAKSLFYERIAAYSKNYGGLVLEKSQSSESLEFDDNNDDDTLNYR